jgi:hypothetical protein
VTRSVQDDDFVGVSTKNIPNKLALMGTVSGLLSAVPVRQAQGRLSWTKSVNGGFSDTSATMLPIAWEGLTCSTKSTCNFMPELSQRLSKDS